MNDTQSRTIEAELKLLEAYWVQIIEKFKTLDERERFVLLNKARKLAHEFVKIDSGFDCAKALVIREGLQITRPDLGRLVRLNQITIYKYETGRLSPVNSKKSAKYMAWINKNGFDKE